MAAVQVPYINRVPPAPESQMLKPSAVAPPTAMQVTVPMLVLLVTEPCGELAPAMRTDMRVCHAPSNGDSDVGDVVAKPIQRCDGCVTAAPPKHQSRSAFLKYGVSGI